MATNKNITLNPAQAQAVEAAVQQWSTSNIISNKLASELLASIQVQEDSFDWQRFAKYTFRVAIICLAIAVVSIVAGNAFLKLIKRVLELPAWLRSTITAAVAAGVHVWGYQRSIDVPLQVWTNEAIHGLGELTVGLAVVQLAEALDVDEKKHPERLNWILLLLAGIYGGTGVITKSNFIWSCGMIVLSGWFGAMTGYQ
ncbi:hypothetical protein BJ170DRAFT_632037 [Xylariales sp. AK1849]|nr:hypothetical protein BJ170DRAFT_632037 [Xylariales sp. AK1849]